MYAASNDWPAGDYTSVPYRLYTDPDIFAAEMQRIFHGDGWSYAGLEAELPSVGDFKTTVIGTRSVVLARDDDGSIHAFENQCAHRGVKFCRREFGNARFFVCPYHQWSYDRRGNLRGVPFINGVKGNGGMPEGFSRDGHGLPRLAVTQRNGVIFVSFGAAPTPLPEYLGEQNRHYFDRVFDGRSIKVLGYARQLIPGNWKLMFENIKDPYHASLLHVFLVTFGLFRADQESQVKMDDSGAHALLISRRGQQQHSQHTLDMANLKEDFVLEDPRLLDPVREFDDTATVVMQTIWPNLIVQQQSNTLALRQLRPRSPRAFELHWTFFGYADDSPAMTERRLRQANLMSAAGLVSGDDSEVIKLAQDGIEQNPTRRAVLLMGGHDTADTEHMVTEAAVRAFYRHYRAVMQL